MITDAPVTVSVPPSNVKLLWSSSSPPDPASTTLPSVRSDTAAELAVRPPVTVRPDAMLAPPSTSNAPVTVSPAPTVAVVAFRNVAVAIPDTDIAEKFAPCPPPRT